MTDNYFRSLEICAGAGGQALGLEKAGFKHEAVVEIDRYCCSTLRLNRPGWRVFEKDVRDFTIEDAHQFAGIDLLAGGLPCPPFSIAGQRLGENDERNLFPVALDIIDITRPSAVMLENVRGFLGAVFEDFRQQLKSRLDQMGYHAEWHLLSASDYGVPQLRPRVVIVAFRKDIANEITWPVGTGKNPSTVGQTLFDLMASNGWKDAEAWSKKADDIAPTIVGGSMKHGGPDLGPTRAKRAWATLGVDGMGIANEAPEKDFVGMPRLTVPMVSRLQGFPDDWKFSGKKTASYRQVGNAFPPPVAQAVAENIYESLNSASMTNLNKTAV